MASKLQRTSALAAAENARPGGAVAGVEMFWQQDSPFVVGIGEAVMTLLSSRRSLRRVVSLAVSFDVVAGGPQKDNQFQFHLNDKVTCQLVQPGNDMGSNTPKFLCDVVRVESADGRVQTLTPQLDNDPVKVKLADNREVHAKIVATRLLAALGFYTDAWFPIRVECTNCPADPESGSGEQADRVFNRASIVREFDGHSMYEVGKDDQGWNWKEIEELNIRPTYEKDGLKLMAAFIRHSDNKLPQRLVCDDVHLDTTTHPSTTSCAWSRMLIQDVGATFGGGGLFTLNGKAKMNLHGWSNKSVWNEVGSASAGADNQNPPECQAELHKSLTAKDGLNDPTISEDDRRFAAGLLCPLSDQQVTDLFRVARVAEMPEYHNDDGTFKEGMTEASIVQQWVTVFKQKREAVARGRCRWKSQPSDLNVIDNPRGAFRSTQQLFGANLMSGLACGTGSPAFAEPSQFARAGGDEQAGSQRNHYWR